MQRTIQRVSFIGAGNLASHLIPAFLDAGVQVMEVFSRTGVSAARLVSPWNIPSGKFPAAINPRSHAVVIAVSDDAIPEILGALEPSDKILIHTSGSIPATVLGESSPEYGVIYPLQTFTRNRPLDFRQIPLFIEGSTGSALEAISQLAGKISDRVTEADSEVRLSMHVAAVFASNFQNHLYRIAVDILKRNGLSISALEPLIRETMEKSLEIGPENAQTGPAVRNDHRVIEKHLGFLGHDTGRKEIYRLLSDDIIRTKNRKDTS
ncbi:MAG: Rossmann-like and DUF2520 domain-containing protein [Bacteroidales bacterium]